MTSIIANGFGVLSTIAFIVSFQIKSNKGLFITQSIANVFYGIQFYLLGATGGLFTIVLQIVRNMLLLKIEEWTWLKWKGWAIIFCIPSLLFMILGWTGPIDILPFIAYTVGTICYWTNDAKILRLSEIVGVSPAWLTYDILSKAYGGVLTELVILASVFVSIFRFGWKGLEDPEFKK